MRRPIAVLLVLCAAAAATLASARPWRRARPPPSRRSPASTGPSGRSSRPPAAPPAPPRPRGPGACGPPRSRTPRRRRRRSSSARRPPCGGRSGCCGGRATCARRPAPAPAPPGTPRRAGAPTTADPAEPACRRARRRSRSRGGAYSFSPGHADHRHGRRCPPAAHQQRGGSHSIGARSLPGRRRAGQLAGRRSRAPRRPWTSRSPPGPYQIYCGGPRPRGRRDGRPADRHLGRISSGDRRPSRCAGRQCRDVAAAAERLAAADLGEARRRLRTYSA